MDLWASNSMDRITLKAGPSDTVARGVSGVGGGAWVYYLMCACITLNGWKCYIGNFCFFIGFWFKKKSISVFLLILTQSQDLQLLESPLLYWPIKLAQASIPCTFPGFMRDPKMLCILLVTSPQISDPLESWSSLVIRPSSNDFTFFITFLSSTVIKFYP